LSPAADERMDVEMRETTFPWWLVLLEGIFAAIFGFLLLIAPGGTLVFLVQVLGFYLLIEGILRLVSIFVDSSLWGLKLAIGILGILGGMVVLNHPLWSALAIPTYIVYIVGFLAIFQGVGGLIQMFRGDGWGGWHLGHLGHHLWHHRTGKPPDRRGGTAVRLGSVDARRRHYGDRGVVQPSFEFCWHSGQLSFREEDTSLAERAGVLHAPALSLPPGLLSFREDLF
jgi:uncharacterized membrane protein HdeD (DUF308 family)